MCLRASSVYVCMLCDVIVIAALLLRFFSASDGAVLRCLYGRAREIGVNYAHQVGSLHAQ